jgi:hypothetical protein
LLLHEINPQLNHDVDHVLTVKTPSAHTYKRQNDIWLLFQNIETDKYVRNESKQVNLFSLLHEVSVYDKEVLYTLNISTLILIPSGEISHLAYRNICYSVSANLRSHRLFLETVMYYMIGDPSYIAEHVLQLFPVDRHISRFVFVLFNININRLHYNVVGIDGNSCTM